MRLLRHLVLLLLAASPLGRGAPAEELSNRFGDPFLALSTAVDGCPEPLGPRITATEKLQQSHHRAERGTTCWLQGVCERPNAFEYDAQIAEDIRRAWPRRPEFHASSIWLTVQGRIVYFEGCAGDARLPAALESFGRSIPKVMQAVAAIATSPGASAPYPVWPASRGIRK